MIDFSQYRNQGRYSVWINEGYSMALNLMPLTVIHLPEDQAQAIRYGYEQAQRHMRGEK